jgi:hypothetical protein
VSCRGGVALKLVEQCPPLGKDDLGGEALLDGVAQAVAEAAAQYGVVDQSDQRVGCGGGVALGNEEAAVAVDDLLPGAVVAGDHHW